MADDERDASDRRVAALLDEDGMSFRQAAKLLGMSLGGVQRAVRRVRQARATAEVARTTDPVLALLSAGDIERLRVSAGDVAGGLTGLQRYRMLGLPEGSAAGDAARGLFDHGRSGDAFTAWLAAGRVPAPVAAEPVPAHVRDDRIVELRREGWTLAQIGAEVGMTKGAVSRALDRIYAGRPGQQPRG